MVDLPVSLPADVEATVVLGQLHPVAVGAVYPVTNRTYSLPNFLFFQTASDISFKLMHVNVMKIIN